MNKEIPVVLNGILIGKVYPSSHGGWVAQPAWNIYSCTFLTEDQARLELIFHYNNQGKSGADALVVQ